MTEHIQATRNGRGRFTASEAQAIVGLSADDYRDLVYPRLFHEVAKQMMWELRLLFAGQVVDSEGRTHELHSRLAKEQREETREAFCTLWAVLNRAKLERSPLAAAKADAGFQRFIEGTFSAPAKRRGRKLPEGPRRAPDA